MRFGDKELFTLDTLTAQAAHASFGQEVDVTTVEQGVTEAVRMLSRALATQFFVTLEAPCPTCELDLGLLGITGITSIQGRSRTCCAPLCWLNLPWWEMDGTNLRLPPLCPGAELRIEFYIEPAVDIIQTQFTTDVAFDGALDTDLKLAFTPSDALPIAPKVIPAAGYIHLPGTGGVYEYVGREIYVDPVGGTQFVLHNMTSPEWNKVSDTIALGSPVEFMLALSSNQALAAINTLALSSYWTKRLMTCTSDDQRNFASQMVVFWRGEAEKTARRIVQTRRVRMKFKDALLLSAAMKAGVCCG